MKSFYLQKLKGITCTLFVVFIIISTPVFSKVNTLGVVSNISIDKSGEKEKVVVKFNDLGICEITPFSQDVFRVTYNWGYQYGTNDIAVQNSSQKVYPVYSDSNNVFLIKTDSVIVELIKSPNFKINFISKDSGKYLSKDENIQYDVDFNPLNNSAGFRVKTTKVMEQNDAFLGLGEYPGPINRRGLRLTEWNTNKWGWDAGQNPMYMSLPFFYSYNTDTKNVYGIFFNNPAKPVFDMGKSSNNSYSFEASEGILDYFFISGGKNNTFKDVLTSYSKLTGLPPMMPKWAMGYHQSRYGYGSQQKIEEVANKLVENKIPVDAIYLDIENQDSHKQLTLNSSFYNVNSNENSMVAKLRKDGIKIVPLIEPFLHTQDPMYNDAFKNSYFIKENNKNTYTNTIFIGKPVSWFDFSSNDTRIWWKGKLTSYLNTYSFDGIWNDLNEPEDGSIPLNVVHSNNRAFDNSDKKNWHLNMKNTYALLECSLSREALLAANPEKRPFVLSRSGWPGIQRYAINWSGDNRSTFENMKWNIPLGTSVMISGQVNFGHDVGGFVGKASDELLTRWLEWGALTPFYRNHSDTAANAQEPYLGNNLDANRKAIEFRYEIMPYLYSLMYNSSITGIPMNTPVVFAFPEDKNTLSNNDFDFMVGDYMFVSPIINPGQTNKSFYLPTGYDWYNWYTDGKVSNGGYTWIDDTTIGKTPIFIREGAIIPTTKAVQNTEIKPEFLNIHIWNKSGNTNSTLYDDDGTTNARNYSKRDISSSSLSNKWDLVIGNSSGDYVGNYKSYTIIKHDTKSPLNIVFNNTALSKCNSSEELNTATKGFFYDIKTRLLYIKIPYAKAECKFTTNFDTTILPLESITNTYRFPDNPEAKDDIWINTESYPSKAGVKSEVIYTLDNGINWITKELSENGTIIRGTKKLDQWHLNIGKLPKGTTLKYKVKVYQEDLRYLEDTNNGNFYSVTVKYDKITFTGNVYNFPANGNIKLTDKLWLNIQVSPAGAASSASQVIFGSHQLPLTLEKVENGKDCLHASIDLNRFTPGDKINYQFIILDYAGNRIVNNNDGKYYTFEINYKKIESVGGIYHFPMNNIKPWDTFWFNIKDKPIGSVKKAALFYKFDNKDVVYTKDLYLEKYENGEEFWHYALNDFPAGTSIKYWFELTDEARKVSRYDNYGKLYTAYVDASNLIWNGNVTYNISNSNSVAFKIETFPINTTASVKIMFSYDNGKSWSDETVMAISKFEKKNDFWEVSKSFSAENINSNNVLYKFKLISVQGNTVDNDNTGKFYRITR